MKKTYMNYETPCTQIYCYNNSHSKFYKEHFNSIRQQKVLPANSR